MATNKLDKTGLSQVWSKIVELFVQKEEGKVLSEKDFTATYEAKLNAVEDNAQVNKIESLKVNGVAVTVSEDKTANIEITEGYSKEEVDNKVSAAISGVYKVKGSVAFAELPTEGMAEGHVYNISDEFTTTDAFVGGAGVEHPAGTNVVYTEDGWDTLAGIWDMSEVLMKSDVLDITEAEINEICVIPAQEVAE